MKFTDYIENDNAIVSFAANILAEIESAYAAGKITREQLKELSEDTIQLIETDTASTELEIRNYIQQHMGLFKTLLKAIK